MAKKRKKKVNQYQQQKIAQAQYKKVFRQKLKFLLNAIGCTDLYPLIPAFDFEAMFLFRQRNLKIIPGKEGNMPSGFLKIIEKDINKKVRNQQINIMNTGTKMSLLEIDTLLCALKLAFGSNNDVRIIKGINFNERLKDFIEWYDDGNSIFNMLYDEAMVWRKLLSKTTHAIYWFVIGMADINKILEPRIIIEFNRQKTNRKILCANNMRRTIYEVAWAYTSEGYVGATFTPKPKEYNGTVAKPLKVYIQKHALNRLNERLGTTLYGSTNVVDVYYTFEESEKYHFVDGKFYFDFLLLGANKVGYLVGEIIDDILVIKTFLFLTNNGTPEGRKLSEHTGFNKTDKQFLGIDKLSTFLSTDIRDNEKVKQLFIESGCEPLFEVDPRISSEHKHRKSLANSILKYMDTYQKEPENIEELERMMNEEMKELALSD